MSFIFGGDTNFTYDDLLMRRKRLNEAMAATNQTPENPYMQISNSFGRLGNAIASSITDKRIAEQEQQQNSQLMNDFATLNTPYLAGKMKAGMQGATMPEEIYNSRQDSNLNKIMLNPALQRNPNANSALQYMMMQKFKAKEPITPYQQQQLSNQKQAYELQNNTLQSNIDYRNASLYANTAYRDKMLEIKKNEIDAENAQNELQRNLLSEEKARKEQAALKKENYDKKQDLFEMERNLSNDFASSPIVKEFDTVNNTFGRMKSIVANVEALSEKEKKSGGSGASDMSLIFSYMKMLDPTSVVREGEYATAQNTAGVPDAILNYYNKMRDGGFLTSAQRKEFLNLAEKFHSNSFNNVKDYAKAFEPTIQEYGLSKENIFKFPELYKDKKESLKKSNEDYLNDPSNLLTGGEEENPILTPEEKSQKNTKTTLSKDQFLKLSDEEFENLTPEEIDYYHNKFYKKK
jgi:hypothetical protein